MTMGRGRRRTGSMGSLMSVNTEGEVVALMDPGLRELGYKAYAKLNEAQTATAHMDEGADISSLKNVQDVYALFGLKRDDRTQRRDQVKMWVHVRDAMTAEIDELTSSGRVESYDRAKRLRAQLETIRAGFEALQTDLTARHQVIQRSHFDEAARTLRSRLSDAEASRLAQEQDTEDAFREDLATQQRIERETRDYALAIAPPRTERWSKRVLELQRAETALSRLHRYDEAKNVRRMLDKLEKPERVKAKRLEQDKLRRDADRLRNAHDEQARRLHERLGCNRWANLRRSQRERDRQQQRLKNLDLDMTQAHALDTLKKPELTVHPSALLQKRQNHHLTAAANNGNRLLDNVLGKKEDEAVYVAPLCHQHAFEDPLPGVTRFSPPASA